MKRKAVRETADNVEMQGIEFQIINDSDEAADGIEKLSRNLETLENKVGGATTGLSRIASGLSRIKKALSDLNTGTFQAKIKGISDSLESLKTVTDGMKISPAIGNQIARLKDTINQLPEIPGGKLQSLADGLRPLSELGKQQIGPFITQLKKIPEVTESLAKVDMEKFTKQMTKLADTMKPFADEMQKVSNGFSAFPSKIQKLITSTEKYSVSTQKATKRTNALENALKKINFSAIVGKVTQLLGRAVRKASDYQEVLNLFSVAMGDYAEEAYDYAQTVSEAMGIDPAQWMENEGVFNTIITGFGVAGDKAAFMSKNLTQLGYDLASFYNISFTDAMQKVQSGISGELEPMRRLGYDLSVARLEQERLNLSIDKSVSSMTQAEKSQLRYYAMLTQVTKVQGDMARTIDQPANMLRVMKAELEQVSRAIGNLFIPILTKALPWLIAIAKAVREIVAEIARLFNVEIGEVDWSSGFSTAAGASGEIDDNMENAAGAAKDLKRYLAGFDELNVLPEKNDSGSGSVSVGGGGGLDIPLPGYDFLGDEVNKRVDKIYASLKKIITPIKKILGFLQKYKDIVKAAAGVAALAIIYTKVNKIITTLKAANLFSGLKGTIDTFVTGFQLIKVTGGNTLQSIVGGIDNVRMGLSGLQKGAITAVAGFAEFDVIKSSVEDLALGCDNAGSKIVQIGVAAGAAAAAMYVALGPAGLAVAAATALAGAIAGVVSAQNKMLDNMVNDAFYSGAGAKISDITDQFVNLMDTITESKQPFIENKKTMDDMTVSIDKTTSSLSLIAHAIEIGATTAEEKIPEIKSLISQLADDTKTKMDTAYDTITLALGDSFGDALEKAGYAVPQIMELIRQIKGDTEGTLDSLQKELDEIDQQFKDGAITSDEYTNRFKEITKQMMEVSGATTDTVGIFDDLKTTMRDIDWEDKEKKDDFFAQITSSAKEAKNSVNESANALIQAFETMRDSPLVSESGKILLDSVIKIADSDRQTKLEEINAQVNTLFDDVQRDILEKTQKVNDETAKKWEKMNFLEKAFNGSTAANYTSRALNDYQTNIVNPINKKIQESMNEIGTGGTAWAGDAMTNILNGLFDTRIINNPQGAFGSANSVFKSDLGTEIQRVLKETGKTGEANARNSGKQIISGLGAGITDNLKIGTWAARNAILSMDSAVRDAAKIHSPSKLFAEDGKYMMEGIAEGFKDKTAYVSKIVTDSVTSLFDNSTGYSTGYSFGQSLANGISQAIKNATYPSLKGTMSTSGGTARMSFSAYASGGFPDPGQFFLARENGVPEMVGSIGRRTAVANNDQIVEALKTGVYEAVVAATGGGNNQNGGQAQVVSANVNGKNLFEFVVDYARGETVRTGANPLLEF